MTILTVGNNPEEQKKLIRIVKKLRPEADLISVESSPAALAEAREHEVDIAFLDVVMSEMNGLVLGSYLKDLHPFINLIYLTDSREDAFEAMALRASGCMLAPPTDKAVKVELDDLRNTEARKSRNRVFIQTFGNFEMFVDGEPVSFKYTRTKEVVAILVNNRGAQTSNGEIIANLWEDDGDPMKKTSYLSNLRQDLQNTLTRLKLNGIILKQRGSMAIAADKVECDLFEWLAKKKDSKYQYTGDYMNQYTWPEYYHAELDEISYAMDDE